MKTFFRYLGYRLKDSALRTTVISLLSFFFTLSTADIGIGKEIFLSSQQEKIYCSLLPYYAMLIALVFLIPMLELSRFKNRRNLDTLYFFPLSRTKLVIEDILMRLWTLNLRIDIGMS